MCAYYDSTLLFPKDVLMNAAEGLGVIVLDMSDPSQPRKTDQLVSPAMQSPHESVLVNKKRGLLAAVLGNAATNAGMLDVYDVSEDCRHPQLLSSTPTAVLGHESGWAPGREDLLGRQRRRADPHRDRRQRPGGAEARVLRSSA